MKVKASTVRKIIRESIRETFEWTPEMKAKWKNMMDDDRREAERVHGTGNMNPDVVYDHLNRAMPHADPPGRTYIVHALDAIVKSKRHRLAAEVIADGLGIPNVPTSAEEDLETRLMTVDNEDDLVGVTAKWVESYWKITGDGVIRGRKPVFQQ